MKKGITILVFVVLSIFIIIPQSFCDDGILVVHGDHFEMVCRDDGLVDVSDTILMTANITQNVTGEPTYSFDGTLVGNISYVPDSRIHECEVEGYAKNGISVINASFKATLEPLKFTKLILKYTVADLLKQDANGTWHFTYCINSFSGGTSEVLLKIPKPPTPFHKVLIEDTAPAPHLFFEESHYYVLVWKSSTFTFGNVSTTLINVSYKTVWNPESFNVWLVLQIAVFFIGVVLGSSLNAVRKWLVKPKVNSDSSTVDKEQEAKINRITFMSIMKMNDLDEKVRNIIAERNLTLAGFTLTALTFIIGFFKENLTAVNTLISSLLLAMFLFFLGSQLAHEAEYFWQMFFADISQYAGVITLMISFYYFANESLQDKTVILFPLVLVVILVGYLVRGAWRIYKFYKKYKVKKETKTKV